MREIHPYANMLEPDYCKARLLEIEVGRRFWQSTASLRNARNFYLRVVKPLRELKRQGVIQKLQETNAIGEGTPIAVQIIGQVDLTRTPAAFGEKR